MLFSLLHFQTCAVQIEIKGRLNSAAWTTNETYRATTTKELAIKTSSHKAQYPSSIYRWIPLYISHLFSIVLLPPLFLIQLSAFSCCQPWAGESTLPLPLSTFHGPLWRGDKHWWIGPFCICIVFNFPLCCQGWWMAKSARYTLLCFCLPESFPNNVLWWCWTFKYSDPYRHF